MANPTTPTKRKPFQTYTLTCEVCGEAFEAKRPHAKTCKSTCRAIKCRNNRETKGLTKKETSLSVKKETRAQSIQRDENTQLSSLPSELGQVNEPKALNYLVITNTFGVGIELCGFRFALVSPILESQTLRGFENHLEKSNPHPHAIYKDEAFERDKQVKVKAFKTILKHKTLILENIHCSQEGCYYFKGLVFPKNSTLTPPRRC